MGSINIFTGTGHGKSPAAIGEALQRAASGSKVVIIQFLKGKGVIDSELISRLEPELKIFRFEKSDVNFSDLPKEKQEEEILNIRNGLNFARKVIATD
ncbi:MAG: cob(I)yrinic acid a,c-diamide adenosyltransferase, partial [Lachnospiraceae bacterium]|nr:cob(I)yrinic acid a,c-diamide adenosyltransferase [Lachnospiraceae bacterium]